MPLDTVVLRVQRTELIELLPDLLTCSENPLTDCRRSRSLVDRHVEAERLELAGMPRTAQAAMSAVEVVKCYLFDRGFFACGAGLYSTTTWLMTATGLPGAV